ncbi:MAG: anthranilate synthase component I family protein [Verrucomicrobiales bacterium]
MVAARPRGWVRGHLTDLAPIRRALADLGAGRDAPDLGIPLGGLFGSVDFGGTYCFGIYPECLVFLHGEQRWIEVGSLSQHLRPPSAAAPPALALRPRWSRGSFTAAVEKALDYIAAGDIYQANLAQPFEARWPGGAADAFALYGRLRDCSPAPMAAFLDQPDRAVLSSSPESFLRMSGGVIRTRPIKGTRPRFADPAQDEKSAYDLLTSQKEIAELVMITDLERNDLGQVCEFGSVRVEELLKLERFAQVFHLVSTVRGTLRGGIDHAAALQACSPGGSISGAPKKRALEIIAELEPFPRGLYTGAVGYLGANGESHFSIAIRTAVAERGRFHFHTGAGIVADSDPGREYEETLHKAAGIVQAAGGDLDRLRA